MEGLRGIAVGLVFFVHYGAAVTRHLHPELRVPTSDGVLETIGHAGVDLFFVLSGFLIYGSLVTKPLRLGSYVRRRVERIYPTFLVVLAIYLVLSFTMPSSSKLPADRWDAVVYVLKNLLLLPGIVRMQPIISVAWSLSYEAFFYVLAPIVVGVLSMRRRESRERILILAALTAISVGAYAVFGGPVRMLMFLAGAMVFDLTSRKDAPAPAAAVATAALLLTPFIQFVPSMAVKVVLMFGGFTLSCWHVLANPRSPLSRLLSTRLLRWFGNMSYSYYLIHGLALQAAFFVVGPHLPTQAWIYWPFLPFAFAATVLVSALLFVWVERPLSLRVSDAIRSGGRAPAAPAESVRRLADAPPPVQAAAD